VTYAAARGEGDEDGEDLVGDLFVFAARPRRDFDDRRVGVGEQRAEVDATVVGGDPCRPPAHGRVGVGERRYEATVVELAEPFERSECRCPYRRIVVAQCLVGRGRITGVPRDCDRSSIWAGFVPPVDTIPAQIRG
jgi:hypothetical protein